MLLRLADLTVMATRSRPCCFFLYAIGTRTCVKVAASTVWEILKDAGIDLVMDLQDAGCRARYLIRERDGKSSDLFDAVLADAGMQVVLTGVRMPADATNERAHGAVSTDLPT